MVLRHIHSAQIWEEATQLLLLETIMEGSEEPSMCRCMNNSTHLQRHTLGANTNKQKRNKWHQGTAARTPSLVNSQGRARCDVHAMNA